MITLPLNKGEVKIEEYRILLDDMILPGEYNPYNKRLWVVTGAYGVLGAVWADDEQEALDKIVDHDLGKSLLIDDNDLKEMTDDELDRIVHLGNSGEPCDLTNVDVSPVTFKPKRDYDLLCKLNEAREAGLDRLGDR